MKKLFLIAAIAISGAAVHAQENTMLVGGNISYTSEKTEWVGDESKSNSFEFSPTIGYQFNKNWTIGVQSSFSSFKSEANDSIVAEGNRIAIGGFIRYAKPLSELFAVYGDVGAGYHSTRNKTADTKSHGFYVGFTPALFINFKNGFGLNFNIGGIRYETMNWEQGPDNSRFNVNFGKEVGIGISKNFRL